MYYYPTFGVIAILRFNIILRRIIMKIQMYADTIWGLQREIENLRMDTNVKIKSISYQFNTIEYYKNNKYYAQATVEIE
jgi:FtsZ-binding cell division protein ZapB